MVRLRFIVIICLLMPILMYAQTSYRIKKRLFQDNFDQKLDTTHWFCELKQPSNNRAFVENGQLVIDVAKGATVWFTQKLKNNWLIEFDRTVVKMTVYPISIFFGKQQTPSVKSCLGAAPNLKTTILCLCITSVLAVIRIRQPVFANIKALAKKRFYRNTTMQNTF